VSGSLTIAGLSAPVRVVRDRWGVPHIYAQNQDDLFIAQGFVQAQDRLFQIDLWRRAAQGRLSEVLGPNFIDRDVMTRRVQYRGDLEAEWASYGPDAKAIASAFVRGVNAWVALARERPPEAFVLAGWTPAFWSPADLLSRTDAFVVSGDAIDEARRANMSDVITDAIRSAGAPPFFMGGVPPAPEQIAVRAAGRAAVTREGALSFREARRLLDHPSVRYFVHLQAPGWNVIGATAPWRPGVAVGHNDRIAWGGVAIDADTQDIFVDAASIAKRLVQEPIVVKRRAQPFVFNLETTAHGAVVAVDSERHQLYSLRWSGTEAGAAPEFAALDVDRATNWTEFRLALERWRMPARRMFYVDRQGGAGFQDAALVPVRRAGEWVGWRTLDELPHAFSAAAGGAASADERRRVSATVAPAAEALFTHPLATTGAAKQRFNIGPVTRPNDDDSPVRATLVPADWDRSRAMNAPGQSESPASAHFADLASLWSSGEPFPLVFSDAAVQANATSTLTLVNVNPR
jgi:penicillin amidase